MKKKAYEHQYQAVPGVKGTLTGIMASSVNGILTALKTYRAVSDAGDHGSIMVYRDDEGRYRCLFMVWGSTREQKICQTQREVREWLKKWMPAQRQQVA
ncbi:MAG TPA: hypothetical protein VNU68_32180 [Verrucomicrobiae bacterium]|nr:hypothetical protein [Verrucomicrobiae bacterium]